ncbi:MAG: pyrroloquinoline-quinone synthase PqqC [Pseudomonadota bacterium]
MTRPDRIVEPLSPDGLEARLQAIGAQRYHRHHPFHKRLHSGQCSLDEVRAWALNRYCYQRAIPRKDATILARLEILEHRRVWRQRIIDHDGELGDAPEGGLRRWLALTDALGFERSFVTSLQGVLPAVQYASEAYVNFVATQPIVDAIASSLTEMFSPQTIEERVNGMLRHYDFIAPDTLRYFEHRLTEAPRDVEFALDYVKTHATSADTQNQVCDALRFKCDMLWSQLDAVHYAYVLATPPPGAWHPGTSAALINRMSQ